MDYQKEALILHEKKKGKIEIKSKFPLKTKDDLAIGYTPGVAEPCREIAKNKNNVYKYTSKGNMVAVITDGTAVLGLGDIGPEAALPVMEGKAILFKEFANVDAFPICLTTKDVDEIVETVKRISPVFGGINLEDISAPRCFEIEERLKKELDIPVFHDDQHGTAVVVLAGLINALKLVNKKFGDIKIVVNGAGAAATAVTKLLLKSGVQDIILLDSKGSIYSCRKDLNSVKFEMSKLTNSKCGHKTKMNSEACKTCVQGGLSKAIKNTDVFIGLSVAKVLSKEMVQSMNKKPIIFAMANPDPEILPKDAYEAGAEIVATGRSDFPNQINNVLAFPGIFRGALDSRAKEITEEMKLAAAKTLAQCVTDLNKEKIMPNPLDKSVALKVAEAVKRVVDEAKLRK